MPVIFSFVCDSCKEEVKMSTTPEIRYYEDGSANLQLCNRCVRSWDKEAVKRKKSKETRAKKKVVPLNAAM